MRIDPRTTIPEVLPSAIEYFRRHPAGGPLASLLDVGRPLTRQFMVAAATDAAEAGDTPTLRLIQRLMRMSVFQRRRLRKILLDSVRTRFVVS